MKLAAIQMVSGHGLEANLRAARRLLEDAARAGADLAVLPEYFCLLGQKDTDKLAIQERAGEGVIQTFLAHAARDFGLWIAGGTLPLSTQDASRVTNSLLVYNPDGVCAARYDKIHLFRFDNGAERYDESRVLRAGEAPCLLDLVTREGERCRVGLSVCYDLRFPELYRHYAAAGAQLLLVPSAFTWTTGQAHWEVLLRARAVENLSWVVAAAQGGLHENGRRTWGHSMVVDPWGTVTGCLPEGEGLVVSEVDLQALADRRRQLPALEHRRAGGGWP